MLSGILLLPFLAGVGLSSRIPRSYTPPLERSPAIPAAIVRDIDAQLEPRITASEVFDIGFELKDEELYAGSWDFAPPKPIPIPGVPVPITVLPEQSIAFTLNCNDCRTYGEIVAEMDTEGDGVTFSLTFNNAGAYLDFGLSATNSLTATFALGHFFSTGNLTSGSFAAKLGLGINLVLSFDAAIDLSGGFQICIPDGTKLAFNVDIGFDADTKGISASSDVTTFPDVTFSLLPIQASGSANITAALILKAEAGIEAEIGLLSGNAAAGASLTIAQVNLGAAATNEEGQCSRALFADIESNAGAFAKAGLTFDEEELFEPPNFNVSTVFATAGTTSCIGTQIPTIPTLAPAVQTEVPECEEGVLPATGLTTVTKTNTLTSCLAAVVNCPASLTQVVVLTKEEAVTTTFCPTASASAPASGSFFITIPTDTVAKRDGHHATAKASAKDYSYVYPSSIATASDPAESAITVAPTSSISVSVSLVGSASSNPVAPACPTNGVKLSELIEFIIQPLPEEVLTIAPAENATITGSPELPPKTTSSAPTGAPTPVVGIVEAGAGVVRAGGVWMMLGLVSILFSLL